jgi:hypothetical protein
MIFYSNNLQNYVLLLTFLFFWVEGTATKTAPTATPTIKATKSLKTTATVKPSFRPTYAQKSVTLYFSSNTGSSCATICAQVNKVSW